MRWTISFRTRILLVVVAVAVVPLGLIGLWLTGTARRSGEELLLTRMSDVLDETATQLRSHWTRSRSQLLDLADHPVVRRSLEPSTSSDDGPSAEFTRLVDSVIASEFPSLGGELIIARAVSTSGEVRWTFPAGFDPRNRNRSGVAVSAAVHESVFGNRLGTIEARIETSALWGELGPSAGTGIVVGMFDGATGASLLPLLFDPLLLGNSGFVWGGEDWLTHRMRLANPSVELVAAAPLTPFVEPFQAAASRGAGLLLIVAVAGLALAALLVRRMTQSLERLAHAADAVSRGDLEQQLAHERDDEVGRVVRAFNTMTESLRRTLKKLADREALAAVGEFAATLAHEVRNPLTAIRIDLQRVEEGLPEDSPLRAPQGRALEEIERLDATVGAALDVARTESVDTATVDVLVSLTAAIHASTPAFEERGGVLHEPSQSGPIHIKGDLGALEQLFLNLLLNAAQALDSGGGARVTIALEEGTVVVTIRDDGRGMTPARLERVFEPLFTTRAGGTGLGLTIALRIASAHGGSIRLTSEPDRGTTVEVRLPLLAL
ncbi:MAG: HAMP domain-containing protein [Gemmatimonadetes bacterium]|nr:HAMP domain-containing protein [Gemmatimonadota bacterium]